MPLVGQQAPYFELQADTGKTVSLAELRGSKVVLYFYPKDNTPGCSREASEFRDLAESFSERNTAILGISQDTIGSHKRFRQKLKLNFPLLSDLGGRVSDSYGVRREKEMAGEVFMTVQRTTFVIDELGVVQHVYEKVQVDGHAEEVLAAV